MDINVACLSFKTGNQCYSYFYIYIIVINISAQTVTVSECQSAKCLSILYGWVVCHNGRCYAVMGGVVVSSFMEDFTCRWQMNISPRQCVFVVWIKLYLLNCCTCITMYHIYLILYLFNFKCFEFKYSNIHSALKHLF